MMMPKTNITPEIKPLLSHERVAKDHIMVIDCNRRISAVLGMELIDDGFQVYEVTLDGEFNVLLIAADHIEFSGDVSALGGATAIPYMGYDRIRAGEHFLSIAATLFKDKKITHASKLERHRNGQLIRIPIYMASKNEYTHVFRAECYSDVDELLKLLINGYGHTCPYRIDRLDATPDLFVTLSALRINKEQLSSVMGLIADSHVMQCSLCTMLHDPQKGTIPEWDYVVANDLETEEDIAEAIKGVKAISNPFTPEEKERVLKTVANAMLDQ